MRGSTTTTAFILAITFAFQVAAADEAKKKAVEEFNKGTELFEKKDYEGATKSFRTAYDLSPTWKLLFNIGQCEAALKRYGLSIEAFEKYLAEGGDDIPIEKKDYVLDELDKMRKMVGGIRIDAPAGLEVWVDGVLRETTPVKVAIPLTAGLDHEVELREDGEVVFSSTEMIRGGSDLAIEYDPNGGEEGPRAPAGVEKEGPVDVEGGEGAGGDGISPVFFWTGLGATVVVGGTTLALYLAVNSRKDSLDSQEKVDSTESMQTAGIALLAVTGALAITTLVLAFFTDFDGVGEKDDENALSVGFLCADGVTGFAIGSRF